MRETMCEAEEVEVVDVHAEASDPDVAGDFRQCLVPTGLCEGLRISHVEAISVVTLTLSCWDTAQ